MDFDIIFVDEFGEFFFKNRYKLSIFFIFKELVENCLDEYLEYNDNIYVEKCEIKLLKPLKYQNKKTNRSCKRTNIPDG